MLVKLCAYLFGLLAVISWYVEQLFWLRSQLPSQPSPDLSLPWLPSALHASLPQFFGVQGRCLLKLLCLCFLELLLVVEVLFYLLLHLRFP
jgi:hypothetical protein